MQTTPSNDLDAAAELVMQGWAQGVFARDRFGDVVPANHPKAVRWCMLGALRKVCDIGDLPEVGAVRQRYEDLKDFLRAVVPGKELLRFNDRSTASEPIVQAIRDAAVMARSQGK